ncbi:MAG: hypothetical protein Q4A28_03565 [Brachymonas sp.]|nr:hypothetical protein [Brachymonas sp.]
MIELARELARAIDRAARFICCFWPNQMPRRLQSLAFCCTNCWLWIHTIALPKTDPSTFCASSP